MSSMGMSTAPPAPNGTPIDDGKELTCLADETNYKRLDDKRRFLLKYYRPLALGPFFLMLVLVLGVFPRILPDTAFWAGVGEALVFGALGFSGLVIAYALSIFLRWFLVRCPRCGWGFGENCGSCGLPRRSNPSESGYSPWMLVSAYSANRQSRPRRA